MRRHWPLAIGLAALLAGTAAAIFYAQAGLTLSHYDARAHVVVARRILDSLTPGWQQIGAIWLPLPHVLNMVPVQVDAWYRSGASGAAISVASTGLAAWAIARLLLHATGSTTGAGAAAALFVLNPNLLFIQSTPMTEPLLLATVFLSLTLMADWIDAGAAGWPHAAGMALTAACMTRYEGWVITAAAIGMTAVVLARRGTPPAHAVGAALKLAAYPAVAIVIFTLNSRWTTGYWFIPRDFFVPENEALGRPWLAWEQLRSSVYQLSGTALVRTAYAGAALVAAALVVSRRLATIALGLAPLGAGLLPWYAFYHGHPERVRYGLLLVGACAPLAGAGIALIWRPLRLPVAAAVLVLATVQAPPLTRTVLVAESQRDARNAAGRRAVTDYLLAHYDATRDGPIMMSMGSLAHYMHDLGRVGFDIHSFLHEGNGQAWQYAALGPKGYVKWVAIEEHAEGGDSLYQAWKRDARFLDGFERVAEGGGVALWRTKTVRGSSVLGSNVLRFGNPADSGTPRTPGTLRTPRNPNLRTLEP